MSDDVVTIDDIRSWLGDIHGSRLERTYASWWTPDGVILARVHEHYEGFRGQERICLVDHLGSVHHWDRDEVKLNLNPRFARREIGLEDLSMVWEGHPEGELVGQLQGARIL